MPTLCPRCLQPVDCRPGAIQGCGCARLRLTDEERARIRAATAEALGGYVCLCGTCLTELAAAAQPFKKQGLPAPALHNGSAPADVLLPSLPNAL